MASIPVALQLYSIREDCKKDLPGTLKAVADMGYAGVEFAGYYDYSADQLKEMLDGLGLQCCGTHTKLDTIRDEQLDATVAFNATLGNPYLIVPSLPAEMREGVETWKSTAALFNAQAAKAAGKNARVGYHNHAFEFAAADGADGSWLDVFLSNTDSSVIMQLDTGNALVGGADPVDYITRYPGRNDTFHLKSHDPANENCLLGEDAVDWPAVFDACETVGNVKWYIVEQERYPVSPMECVARCIENLRKMGKA